MKVLLTGSPGVGKTTAIREVARSLGDDAGGFYTEETRAAGKRTGFDIVTLDGRRAPLSRVGRKSKYRVGKYGVDLQGLDSMAVPSIEETISRGKTAIIDEIGKMELFSEKFREIVLQAFDSPNPVIAVIMLKSNPFADSIKQRPDTKIIEITTANRDLLPRRLVDDLTRGRS